MKDYIYALKETQSNTVFYIGRTIAPFRREMEHRYGAKIYKAGDELKYLYASTLDALNIDWHLEIIYECDEGCEFYEDYFINLYRESPLQNMKKGDTEPWMGRDYSSPEEFVKTREKIIKEQTEKAKEKKLVTSKKRDNSSVEKTIFIGDVRNMNKKVSPGLQSILDRRK